MKTFGWVTRVARPMLVGVALAVAAIGLGPAVADNLGPIDFEAPTYSIGNINGQDGWMKTGPYDVAVVDVGTFPDAAGYGFGSQALRLSNGVTSGSFGDQTFSPGLADSAGEFTGFRHFEASFKIGSTQAEHEPGLFLSVSPDSGDGSRMSYVGFEDQSDGIHVMFYDVVNPGPLGTVSSFNPTDIATLSRTQAHTIEFVIDFLPGPANDIVEVYVDGALAITGTTWEDYYRYDPEQNGNGNIVPTTSKLLFRAGGTSSPATLGNGYLVDNVQLTSSAPSVPINTIVVTPDDMATGLADVFADPTSWFFYNDENDTIEGSLGAFRLGPDSPPAGNGSVEISVTGSQRRNLATYQFAGTPLADITELKFSTYNPSAGNGGSSDRSGYLNFNVSFDGNDTWQRRLVFVPRQNGTVMQDTWQQWDAIAGGNALWGWSGFEASGNQWPDGNTNALRTWADLLASFPDIQIRDTDSWLGIRVGEPYADGYTENIDAFVFGTTAGVTTWDFELFDAAGCRNGGWEELVDEEGDAFKNQGDCIKYMNTGE